MEALAAVLVVVQASGALVGTFCAVYGEIEYVRARRDGRVDTAERRHLEVTARGLRFGLLLVLLASLSLVVLSYARAVRIEPAASAAYWLLIAFCLAITYAAWALSRKVLPFALGSGVIFAAWWFITFLSLGLFPLMSFGAGLTFFTVAAAILVGVLWFSRALAFQKTGA